MKKNVLKIMISVVLFICLAIVIRYVSSVISSNKKYNELKKEVVTEETFSYTDATAEIQREKGTEDITVESLETASQEETSTPETIVDETKHTEEPTDAVIEYTSLSQYINHIPSLEIDHNALIAVNDDYKGWINIPDTNISYPVPQGPDNDFYLHKLFEGKQYEYAGSLFIDAYSTRMTNQDNLIIYGHNMKNGSMFGNLKKFKTKSYFDTHPYIEFYIPDEKRVYLIFSVRTVPADINSLNYALDGFDTQEYINEAILTSEQSRNININKNGFEDNQYTQIITLSTCVGDTSKRLIVNGIRIK